MASKGMGDAAQEILSSFVLRCAEDIASHALLDNFAAVDEDHPIGYLAGEAHLMRHHDHRQSLVGEQTHYGKHLAHQFGIERRRGLIKQDRLWLHRKGPRDRDALLLA